MKMRSVVTICTVLFLGLSATQAASEDKTATELLYEELMGKMLADDVDWYPSHMNEKSGDKNTYRDGIRGSAHKAFSSCLKWDKETVLVSYQGWDIFGSRDWSYAEFGAMRECLKRKKRYNKDCTCHVLDHDDENVLKVPADFLELYEKKLAAEGQQ